MALELGVRLGPYEVLSAIGAGGMGEVYRARDTHLNRDVAIKILPEIFALDADRLARFRREAQILASLNHPNIAGIHGFERSNGLEALVLELVEGPTLADRIADGPIPIDESLAIARQIAEALEAAHEHAIIHRDLKPANIKLRPDGTVKVLDFGLAKALEPPNGGGPEVSASPTITSPALTRMGVIVGTAAYMSPEQAKGRAADKRSDVWAFGCVLYEMLTGQRAFEGEDVSDTLALILRGEPNWAALPATVPPSVRALLKRCLERDRRKRVSDVAAAKFVLDEGDSTAAATATAGPTRRTRGRMLALAVLALLMAVSVAGNATWAWRWWTALPPQPVRFGIMPPAAHPLAVTPTERSIAITPDGRQVLYVAGADRQLMIRNVNALDGTPLRGIADVRNPFVSPDGRWIGFSNDREFKKVSITGGPAIPLVFAPRGPRGATWDAADRIVFATADPASGLMSMPAGGGKPTVLTTPDATRGEVDHLFPSFLPDGRFVLFTITAGSMESGQVAVLDLETGKHETLIRGGSAAEYVDTGHLIYAAAGTLRVVRFDRARRQVLSDPVLVVDGVMMAINGAAQYAVSRTGTLVYIPGPVRDLAGAPRSLTWVNRKGEEEPINAPSRPYGTPRISPDGTRVAVSTLGEDGNIWVWDLARETLTQLTFAASNDLDPVWTPRGDHIIFSSGRQRPPTVFMQAADGTGASEMLAKAEVPLFPLSVTPDGLTLLARTSRLLARADLVTVTLGPSRRIDSLAKNAFEGAAGDLSPNGRWLAYQSDESGPSQVYVRPFPNVNDGQWLISVAGGRTPRWAPNGREIFYIDGDGALMAVPVEADRGFRAFNPVKLLEPKYAAPPMVRHYDVSRDGRRFLMIKGPEIAAGVPSSLVVVLNWSEELKTRVSGTH